MNADEIMATKSCLDNLLALQESIETLVHSIHDDDGTREKHETKCKAMLESVIIIRCMSHHKDERDAVIKQLKKIGAVE